MIRRPFNWERDCPLEDFARRHFGRIIGRGRGLDLDALAERRLTPDEEARLRDFEARGLALRP